MSILIVTAIEGAENCAAAIAAQLGFEVEATGSRKSALAALRQREYEAVAIDETIAACDPAAAAAIWKRAGLAIPIEVNFALCGAARVAREIRSALRRREREQALAERAAATAIESRLKTTVAGLLLHSQLALSDGEVPPQLAEKLRMVADLAGNLRRQLNGAPPNRGHVSASAPQ